MMWFEPLSEIGTFLLGCAAIFSSGFFKKNLKRDFCPLHSVEKQRVTKAHWVENFGGNSK